MVGVYLLIFVIVFLFTGCRFKNMLRMNLIYTTVWCLGAVLVTSGYAGLFEISTQTHIYIITSLIAFNLVYLLCDNDYFGVIIPKWGLRTISYQLIVTGHAFAYIFMIPVMIRAIKMILSSGWFAVRYYAYTESVIASGFQLRIYAWLINPLFGATFLIASIMWVSRSKYRNRLMILSLFDLLIITLSFGGRYNIVKFVLFFVCAYKLRYGYVKQREHINMKYITVGCVVACILIYLTSLRSLKGLSFIQNAFVYLFGSLVYFDLIIKAGFSPLNAIKLHGNATFGIFTSIPMYIMYQITGINQTPEFLVDQTSNDFLFISKTFRYNAFTTWLFPFWKDFGNIGVVIGVSFVVMLFCRLKRKVAYTKRLTHYALLVYVSYCIFTSTLSYNLMTIQQTITLLFVILFTRRTYALEEDYIYAKAN